MERWVAATATERIGECATRTTTHDPTPDELLANTIAMARKVKPGLEMDLAGASRSLGSKMSKAMVSPRESGLTG
jgi:hypothetical protein